MKTNELNKRNQNYRKELKILVVIHGYPPYYIAGSEVYTRNKCIELAKDHKVFVFSRIEDEYSEPYEMVENNEDGIRIIRVNKPGRDYTFRSKYIDKRMAEIFEKWLIEIKPDIVHINHLSHLTVLIVEIIKKYGIPIVFTLHDYWMMCVRGQLIRDDYSLCKGPETGRCVNCNEKYFISQKQARQEVRLWLNTLYNVNDKIDMFIAPSRFLRNKYIEYGIPEHKIVYKDYGFNLEYFKEVVKKPSERIRFGFLGRIITVKGIIPLIESFNDVDHSRVELNIYGRLPSSYQYLKKRCQNSAIHFRNEFNYEDIGNVFSNIDVLVVPSIWYENSPLVIHEAFLANVPVITSNLGGMAELVQDGINGLLFEVGNTEDLKGKINKFIDAPELISELTKIKTPVSSIQQDVREIIQIYYNLLHNERS